MNRRPIIKAIGGLLLAFALLIAAIPVLPVSAAYENTHVNTGNQRQDIVAVALTQVGYMEGWNNDTKYGAWYSTAVGWNMNNQPWCGMFICWCANQAGIPTSVISLTGWAHLQAYGITDEDIFTYGSGRVPQPGDLFSRDGAHAGIVYQVNEAEGYFLTIEGNTYANGGGEGVYIRTRYLNDSRYTYYFGSPNYTSDHTHNYSTAFETGHPHKEYRQCSICNNKVYTGSTKTVDTCAECIQADCTHSYDAWVKADNNNHKHTCSKCGKVETANHNWNGGTVTKNATCAEVGYKDQTCQTCNAQRTVELPKLQTHSYDAWVKADNNNHKHTCSKCGKVETANHNWNGGKVTKNATCAEVGYKDQTCQTCNAQRTVEIPKLTTHTYTEWEKTDEEKHSRKCTVCNKVDSQEHNCPEEWSTSQAQHWFECTDCKELVDLGDHDFNDNCENPCEICGYVRAHGHALHENWDISEAGHYHGCNDCLYQVDFAAHTISSDLAADETGHYYPCEVCGYRYELQPHIPGLEATEEAAQLCTHCDYEIAPKKEHIHDFLPLAYDQSGHWGSCLCGERFGPEEHQWDISTKACALCQAPMVVQERQIPWFWINIGVCAVAGAIALTVVIVVIVAAVKKRKKQKVLQGV